MNRFIKWVLIAAAVCLTAGLLMSGCAASMGGSVLRIDGDRLLSDGFGGLVGRIVRGNQLHWIPDSMRGISGIWDDTDEEAGADGYESAPLVNEYLLTDIRVNRRCVRFHFHLAELLTLRDRDHDLRVIRQIHNSPLLFEGELQAVV